jgi:hypothetical protein
MRKAALPLGLLLLAAVSGVALAGAGAAPAAGIAVGFLCVAGVVASHRVRTGDLAYFGVGLLVLTITWNGIRVSGGAFGDAFMALAFAGVVSHLALDKRPVPVPAWLFVAGIGLFLAGLLDVIFPPSSDYDRARSLRPLALVFAPGG